MVEAILKPIQNFDLRKGKFGLGAIEVVGRYNYLNIGQEVFTNGLADRNLWTNQLYTTDLGVNWYWNQFLKVYIGWQHAGFGDPVLFAPGRMQKTSDQFWLQVPDLLLSHFISRLTSRVRSYSRLCCHDSLPSPWSAIDVAGRHGMHGHR